MGKFINGLLFLSAILAIGLILSGYKENFELMPGNYPSSLVKGLVSDTYPMQPNPGLSLNTIEKQYLINPTEFAGGYDQATNNKKYWDSPCDGTAYPPNICGGLYQKIKIKKPKSCNPGFDCRRVNFYCSSIN